MRIAQTVPESRTPVRPDGPIRVRNATPTTTVGSTNGTRSIDHRTRLPRTVKRANTAAPGTPTSTHIAVDKSDSHRVNHATRRIEGSRSTEYTEWRSQDPCWWSPRPMMAATGHTKNTARNTSGGAASAKRQGRRPLSGTRSTTAGSTGHGSRRRLRRGSRASSTPVRCTSRTPRARWRSTARDTRTSAPACPAGTSG